MLDVSSCRSELRLAQTRAEALVAAVNGWVGDPQAVDMAYVRDETRALDAWVLRVHVQPPEDLAQGAKALVASIRDALDYLAWQLFLDGGGDPNSKAADRVFFPIGDDEQKWKKRVQAMLPNASPAVREAMAAVQPFKPSDGQQNLFDALADLSNASKHRNPALAVAVFRAAEITASQSIIDSGLEFAVGFNTAEVAVQPGQHVLCTYVASELGQMGVPVARALMPDFEQPPPVSVRWGFIARSRVLHLDEVDPLLTQAESVITEVEAAARAQGHGAV